MVVFINEIMLQLYFMSCVGTSKQVCSNKRGDI
ncbi:hypothetical protein NVP1193O_116 [Vibrio phage 1.193.O._10N.286.52.C6]|nr:hypothetical protein NVP1193O_116 [Vibrio phage 1.193.O._10N.286.52.C6]